MFENATLEEPAPQTDPAPQEPAGAAPPVAVPGGATVLALWLPTPARRRLIDADLEIVEDVSEGPSLILASTRGPAARRPSVRQLASSAPVVVVCHPGGEQAAAEMVAMGASMVVAEGLETSAIRLLDGSESDHVLGAFLDATDRRSSAGVPSVDAVTGLGSSSRFESSLGELAKSGVVPWLGLVDLGLGALGWSLGPSGQAGLKRRLATLIDSTIRAAGGSVFDLGDRLGLLLPEMTAEAALDLGTGIVGLGDLFAPSGDPLDLAVGWAGPASASDPGALALLADRALDVALGRESRVVDAAELSEHAAASVELAAMVGIADLVDRHDPRGDHSVRVSGYAADLAHELQLEPDEVGAIGLAGRLHDIGKAQWGSEAFDPEEEAHATARDEHAQRGEQMVRPGAGSMVASIIRAHHECWDGTGGPDGLAGEAIPLGARLLAVAHLYDELAGSGVPALDIETRLREAAGLSLDPDLTEAAIALFLKP